MGKPEFGRKMTCTACAVRFFDLSRAPAICPKCGTEQPRPKPRAVIPARAASIRWPARLAPSTPAAAAAPADLEADPLEAVEDTDEEEEDADENDLPDDEDDEPKPKIED